MDIVKVCLLGLGGVMLAFLLKGTRPEYVYFVTLGIGLIILGLAVGKIRTLFMLFEEMDAYISMQELYMPVLIKMIGITYIVQFSSGICKDAGYLTTGNQIELFGRLSVMVLSMPILLALLETIQGFIR